jgi:hypothetical protein
MARRFVIQVPVADLRREGRSFDYNDHSHQEIRETQLLFGERIELLEERGEWLRVSVLGQLCFEECNGWRPYQGWVNRSEIREVEEFDQATHVVSAPFLSFGTQILSYGTLLTTSLDHPKVRRLSKGLNRALLVEDAALFLGSPYLWGGCAFPLRDVITGVDCSALIYLIYRAQGVVIPRNAYEQYLKSRPTLRLLPGDPLYLAREERVNHVVLKLDGERWIESPQTGKTVRLLHWGSEIWEAEGRIHIFDRPYSYTPYPATFTY